LAQDTRLRPPAPREVQQAKIELAGINRTLKQMKRQVAVLEERKAKLLADFPTEAVADAVRVLAGGNQTPWRRCC
jgi:hypothetical protein